MTPHQAKTLEFLKTYSAQRNGVMPSFDEIAAHLGIRSKSGVSRIMDALVDRGMIRRSHLARSIAIVKSDDVAAERERCACIADRYAAAASGAAVNACLAIAATIRRTP